MKIKSVFLCTIMMVTTFLSQAQKDSTVNITLSAQHHAFIVAFMPSKSTVDDIKYLNQVAQSIELDSAGHVKDTTQQISVIVNFDQVKNMYLAIGSAQERLAAFYNTQIKEVLIPQLYEHPTLLEDILAIKNKSSADTEFLIGRGFEYLKAIR